MKQLLFTLFLGFTTCFSNAQQDLFNENPVNSPLINEDHTVMFQIKAPDAATVSVSGSLDVQKAFAPITYEMKKAQNTN